MEASGKSNKGRKRSDSDEITALEDWFSIINLQESFNPIQSPYLEETKLLSDLFNLGEDKHIWNNVKDNIDFSDPNLIRGLLEITNQILQLNIVGEWKKDTFLSDILRKFHSQESNIPEAKCRSVWEKIKTLAVSNPDAHKICKNMLQLIKKSVKVNDLEINKLKSEDFHSHTEESKSDEDMIKIIENLDLSNIQIPPHIKRTMNLKNKNYLKTFTMDSSNILTSEQYIPEKTEVETFSSEFGLGKIRNEIPNLKGEEINISCEFQEKLYNINDITRSNQLELNIPTKNEVLSKSTQNVTNISETSPLIKSIKIQKKVLDVVTTDPFREDPSQINICKSTQNIEIPEVSNESKSNTQKDISQASMAEEDKQVPEVSKTKKSKKKNKNKHSSADLQRNEKKSDISKEIENSYEKVQSRDTASTISDIAESSSVIKPKNIQKETPDVVNTDSTKDNSKTSNQSKKRIELEFQIPTTTLIQILKRKDISTKVTNVDEHNSQLQAVDEDNKDSPKTRKSKKKNKNRQSSTDIPPCEISIDLSTESDKSSKIPDDKNKSNLESKSKDTSKINIHTKKIEFQFEVPTETLLQILNRKDISEALTDIQKDIPQPTEEDSKVATVPSKAKKSKKNNKRSSDDIQPNETNVDRSKDKEKSYEKLQSNDTQNVIIDISKSVIQKKKIQEKSLDISTGAISKVPTIPSKTKKSKKKNKSNRSSADLQPNQKSTDVSKETEQTSDKVQSNDAQSPLIKTKKTQKDVSKSKTDIQKDISQLPMAKEDKEVSAISSETKSKKKKKSKQRSLDTEPDKKNINIAENSNTEKSDDSVYDSTDKSLLVLSKLESSLSQESNNVEKEMPLSATINEIVDFIQTYSDSQFENIDRNRELEFTFIQEDLFELSNDTEDSPVEIEELEKCASEKVEKDTHNDFGKFSLPQYSNSALSHPVKPILELSAINNDEDNSLVKSEELEICTSKKISMDTINLALSPLPQYPKSGQNQPVEIIEKQSTLSNSEDDILVLIDEFEKCATKKVRKNTYNDLALTLLPQYRNFALNKSIKTIQEQPTLLNSEGDISVNTEKLETCTSKKSRKNTYDDLALTPIPQYPNSTTNQPIKIIQEQSTLFDNEEDISVNTGELETRPSKQIEKDTCDDLALTPISQYPNSTLNQPEKAIEDQSTLLHNEENTTIDDQIKQKELTQVSHHDLDFPRLNNATKLSNEVDIPAIIAKLCKTYNSQTTKDVKPQIESLRCPIVDTPNEAETPTANFDLPKEEISPDDSVAMSNSSITYEHHPHSFLRTIDIILKIMEGTLAGAYRISQNCTGPLISLPVVNTMNSIRLSLDALKTHFSYYRQDTFEPITSIIRHLLTPAVELLQTICPELNIPDVDFYPTIFMPAPEPQIPTAPNQKSRPEYIVTSRDVCGTTVFDNHPLPSPAQPPRLPLYRMEHQDPYLGVYCTSNGFIRIQLPSTYIIDLSIDSAIYIKNFKDKTSAYISSCGNFAGIDTNLCRVNQHGKVTEIKIDDYYSNKMLFGKIGVRGVQFGGWSNYQTAHLKEDGQILPSGYVFPDLGPDFIQDLFSEHSTNGPEYYELCCEALHEFEMKTLCDGSNHIYWRDIYITQYPTGDITISRNHCDFYIWFSPEVINLQDNIVRKGMVRLVTPIVRATTTVISTTCNIDERFVLVTQDHQWLYYNANDFIASNELQSAGFNEERNIEEEDQNEACGYHYR